MPSPAISCDAPLKARIPINAMEYVKKLGNGNESAISPKRTAVSISVNTTKNFFVLNISRNPLHNGFSVQGIMTSEVQKAILESDIPMFVNMSTEATDIATNGKPIPK